MWSNQHPVVKGFRPLRAPSAPGIARAAAQNMAELTERATAARIHIDPGQHVSVQIVPYARVLAASHATHPVRQLLPLRWFKLWQGTVQEEYGGGIQIVQGEEIQNADSSIQAEDVIED
jgi:hypothetical protein